MKLPVDKRVNALGELYEAAELRLSALVSGAVNRGAKGTAAFYAAQLREVRSLLSELQDAAIPQATGLVGSAYVDGAKVADATLGLSGAFSGVHQEAVDVLADNLVNRLNEAAVTVGRQVEDVFRRAALRETALGLLEGATRKNVSESLRQRFVEDGITGFTDRAGRRWKMKTYCEMVARTTTREAVSMGTANRLLEHGHDLVTISSHSHETDECTPYQGKTFSMTGATKGYPTLDRYPPFHPNCVHVLTPAAATFEAFEKAIGGEEETPKVDPLAPGPKLQTLGDNLHIDTNAGSFGKRDIAKHLEDMELVPDRILKSLKVNDVEVWIGGGKVPDLDDMGHLMNIRPRGYGEGDTWSTVAGAYAPDKKYILAGSGQSGSVSLAIHETGHALDHVLGYASRRPDFIEQHKRIYSKLGSYEAQGGPGGEAGCSELFAEGFAYVLKDEKGARKVYDDEFVDYMLGFVNL